MSTKYLKPSEILYSQDTIKNFFHADSPHRYKMIGETLDDICEGRCRISDIPRISVIRRHNLWITADNRRLWIFQNLERLGHCSYIKVKVCTHIPPEKMTSISWGRTVTVRRDPGGLWHRKVRLSNGRQSSVRAYEAWDHDTAWVNQRAQSFNYESASYDRTTGITPESRVRHVDQQNPNTIDVWRFVALTCILYILYYGFF